MAKVELKTKRTESSVEAFLNTVEDDEKRADCFRVADLMSKLSGDPPRMWGPSIVGFGRVHMKYPSGRELDWMKVGFSPRKANLTLYITDGFAKYDELMSKLGKHKTGKSCLYIKRLADIDMNVLEELVTASLEHIGKGATYPPHE